jgi:uncharacterized Zn finger protein
MTPWDDSWWHYEPADPLEVEGGITARTRHGRFGRKWWGRRWVETLESFDIGARLGRGRSYARQGQVASLKIGAGEVVAEVQGTRRRPYEVRIALRAFSDAQWKKVIDRLRRAPAEVGLLINGEMPEHLEEIFAGEGLSLFPSKSKDLGTDCSCPDWSNPCKHIAAVYYLLADVFDDDPFFLLRLRGMDRRQLLEQLSGVAPTVSRHDEAAPEHAPRPVGPALPTTTGAFWSQMSGSGLPAILPPEESAEDAAEYVTEEADVPPALLVRLGRPPLWQSAQSFTDTLHRHYRQAEDTAMEYFLFSEDDDEELS